MNFGILCNGNSIQAWQAASIKILLDAGHECVLIIQNDNEFIERNIVDKFTDFPVSNLIYRFWFRYILKPDAKLMVPMDTLGFKASVLKCNTIKKGYSEYFSEKDVKEVNSYKLDFILRYGFSILKGEILDAAKFGIWSYHHDDEQKYRGIPTGFWEILFSDPVNAAILQRITSKIDGGVILHKSYFATINHSWKANLQNLLVQSVDWPELVCRKIENGNNLWLEIEKKPETPIYRAPKNFTMLHFLVKLVRNKLVFHFADLFLFEKWQIGIIRQDLESIVMEGEAQCPVPQWVPQVKSSSAYQADPFGFVNKDGIHILSELYDYKTSKGIIVSQLIDIELGKELRRTIALEKPHHLAFPYLFSHEEQWFCLPENSEGRSVDLYKYEAESGKLIFYRTLIENIQAVDASIFYHEGKWWLFFTDRQSTNERLHIWYSNSLDAEFKSHKINPVKTDIRSSRPAGVPFYFDGKLLRPTQDCSLRSGSRIIVNEILELSETAFRENEFVTFVPPLQKSKSFKGMHTFNVTEGLIIIDSKIEVFVWQAFMNKLNKKINKLFIKFKK